MAWILVGWESTGRKSRRSSLLGNFELVSWIQHNRLDSSQHSDYTLQVFCPAMAKCNTWRATKLSSYLLMPLPSSQKCLTTKAFRRDTLSLAVLRQGHDNCTSTAKVSLHLKFLRSSLARKTSNESAQNYLLYACCCLLTCLTEEVNDEV